MGQRRMNLIQIMKIAKNKHMCSATEVLEMEIDIRINEGRKYIEFDWGGLKEVVELKE